MDVELIVRRSLIYILATAAVLGICLLAIGLVETLQLGDGDSQDFRHVFSLGSWTEVPEGSRVGLAGLGGAGTDPQLEVPVRCHLAFHALARDPPAIPSEAVDQDEGPRQEVPLPSQRDRAGAGRRRCGAGRAESASFPTSGRGSIELPPEASVVHIPGDALQECSPRHRAGARKKAGRSPPLVLSLMGSADATPAPAAARGLRRGLRDRRDRGAGGGCPARPPRARLQRAGSPCRWPGPRSSWTGAPCRGRRSPAA